MSASAERKLAAVLNVVNALRKVTIAAEMDGKPIVNARAVVNAFDMALHAVDATTEETTD